MQARYRALGRELNVEIAVETDDLDHALVLEIAKPCLGEVVRVYATGHHGATGGSPSVWNRTRTTLGSSGVCVS
jgi:hypothetical protein